MAVLIPAPAALGLAVFTSVVSVQFVPFHNSVFAVEGGAPEVAKAAVEVPVPTEYPLAVFKSLTSVQLVPL